MIRLLTFAHGLLTLLLSALSRRRAVVVAHSNRTELHGRRQLVRPSLMYLLRILHSFDCQVMVRNEESVDVMLVRSLRVMLNMRRPLYVTRRESEYAQVLTIGLVRFIRRNYRL